MIAAAVLLSALEFAAPPAECRPRCWWGWMNGNVSKEGIVRDLSEMQRLGIGGATVFDLGCGVAAGPVEGLTDAWFEHLRFAGEEAAKRGIEISVHNSSGWTVSGAPWITPENSMKRLAVGEVAVQAGDRFVGRIPLGVEPPRGWVREVSLVAYPAPPAEGEPPPDVGFVRDGENRYVVTLPKELDVSGFEFRHSPNRVWEWRRTACFAVEAEGKDGWEMVAEPKVAIFDGGIAMARDERLSVSLGRRVRARRFRFAFDAPNDLGNDYSLVELRLTCSSKAVPDVKARSFAFRQGFAPIPDVPGAAVEDRSEVVDVSRFMKADGTIDWTAPKDGRLWIVQRTAAISTGAMNGPACERRGGLECDKLDKRGIDAIYEGYVGRLRGMKGLVGVLCDSWEAGSQNWTDALPEEFAARRGYRVDGYWPAFAGRVVGSPAETDRFFRDWRKTIAELFDENYAGRLRELAHRDGLRFMCEPYGNLPGDVHAYARRADLPMSEFWVRPASAYADGEPADENTYPDERCIRAVASSVHFFGRDFADAESFTCAPDPCGRWRSGPATLKACGDAAMAAGISRFTYHSVTHQPWGGRYLPGAAMSVFGTVTEINSPTWPMLRPMADYHARLSYLLSRGRSASRLLYVAPDDPLAKFPRGGFPRGVAYDIVGADAATLVKTDGGRIVAPSGAEYEAVVLAEDSAYEFASAAAVRRIKTAGVRVFRDGEKDFAGVTRDFACTGTKARVRAIRRDYKDGSCGYFVACPDTNAVTLACSFAVTGLYPELWDAETGRRERIDDFREEGGRTVLDLRLGPCGSAFVRFAPFRDPKLPRRTSPAEWRVEEKALKGFTLTFPDGWGCGGPFTLDAPKSWTELPGGETRYFSGTAVYETTMDVAADGGCGRRTFLDLGDVRETAEVFVDGKSVGVLWKPPYRVELTDALRGKGGGKATLRVAVANTWANRLIGDARKPEDCEWWSDDDWRAGLLKAIPSWVKEGRPSPTGRFTFSLVRHYKGGEPLLPAGLLGPVRVETAVPAATERDLVVYGSSPAAIAAAVQARRMGIGCVVVSPETRIGGLTTGGLGQTDIGNKSAFGGIALEFYRAVAAHYRDRANWKWQRPDEYRPDGQCWDTKGKDSMWTFEPSAALKILEGWERENGLEVVRGERLDRGAGGVTVEDGRIVSFRTLSGRVYRGKAFVDATYEGDLMAAAGVSYAVGREANSVYGETISGIQRRLSVSHQFEPRVSAYRTPGDPASGLLPGVEPDVADTDGSGDRRVQAYCFRMCLTDVPENRIPFAKPAGYDPLRYELLLRNLAAIPEESYAKGEWHYMPWINSRMPNRKTDTNNRSAVSTDYIGGNWRWPDASYDERERIFQAHLDYQRGLMWTLANDQRVPERIRKEVSRWGMCRDEFADGPGDGWQGQLYVREARRMVGEYVMTEGDCRGTRKAERPVAMGAYGMDSHNVRRYVDADGFARNEGNIEDYSANPPGEPFVRFGPFPVDYGAIVPKRGECRNLLVPTCISASHMAFGAIRMEPVFFALGQAAGTAAALAIEGGCAVQDVDYGTLAARLRADGQVLEVE